LEKDELNSLVSHVMENNHLQRQSQQYQSKPGSRGVAQIAVVGEERLSDVTVEHDTSILVFGSYVGKGDKGNMCLVRQLRIYSINTREGSLWIPESVAP